MVVDSEFDSDTLQMGGWWQRDIGAKIDGVVNFGEVVFAVVFESGPRGDAKKKDRSQVFVKTPNKYLRPFDS